ncbi:MAG: hypothetical protein WED12_07130 [Chloroflexota bacterium]
MRHVTRLTAMALVLALAGCAALPPGSPSFGPSTAASESPSAIGEPGGTPVPIGTLLPRELHGVELHTFAVGQDSVARLLDELDATPSDLEIAYASEHGARFLQMYALRVRGYDGVTLLDAFALAAYDPATGEVSRTEEVIAGRDVSVVTQATSADRLGTLYLVALDDALVVVQALDRSTAEDGLSAIL